MFLSSATILISVLGKFDIIIRRANFSGVYSKG